MYVVAQLCIGGLTGHSHPAGAVADALRFLPAGAVADASGRLPITTGNGQWREVGGERGGEEGRVYYVAEGEGRGGGGRKSVCRGQGIAYVAEGGGGGE